MDREHEVRRLNRRKRPAAGQSSVVTGLPGDRQLHNARRWQCTAPYLGAAAICDRTRRRLFFSAKFTRLTLLRESSKQLAKYWNQRVERSLALRIIAQRVAG